MRHHQPTQPRIQHTGSPCVFILWLRAHIRLALLLLLVASGMLGPLAQNAGTLFPTAAAHGLTTQATPKPFDPRANSTSINHQPPLSAPRVTRATDTPAPMSPTTGITMPQGLLPLNPDAPTTFLGKDGRFELNVPAGAITAADRAAAGGALQLAIRQVAPASGSSAGGSGLVSFGQYMVQVVDGSGVLASQGLRKPITLKMHVPEAASALDLGRAFVVFNSSPPVGASSAPTSASTPDVRSGASVSGTVPGLGAFSSQRAEYDPTQQTLSTTYTLSGPSALMSFDTNSSVAAFGRPDPFNVDLNAGGLTTSIPLDVPSGPGGLTPPVALTYSSASVSEQHNIQAAAGWAGEGWNLSFGSITWAEHDSNATCTSGCGNGWEDTWQLSDPFGTAVELIPPNINVSTYFDDTANPISTSPIRWHAAPENYAKIYSYSSSLTLPDGGGVAPPCFRVFLPNGIMEEFGCTADSLEYYTSDTSGTVHDFIDAWNLDLITDPQGNQIHITYQQDIAGSVNHYVRDAEPATVEWDSPTCHDAQQICPAATWAPLMRVQFVSSYSIPSSHILQMGAQSCNTGWHLRCDDPFDLSGSGGVGAPGVVSTLALLDALTQVRTTSTGSWNTLKDYQFIYNLQGPRTTTDPATGEQISAAGYFLLERLNVVGMNGVSLPTSSFEYSSQSQTYVDSNFYPTPSTNCGPSWNTGTGNGCFLWSQNQTGNSYFLASYENGMGLHEDFSWQLARNNTHGVPSGGTPTNPFWCNGYQTRSPCQEADDQNWSRVVLTKTESSVLRATSAGNVEVDSSTVMGYVLTPLVAQECTDCKYGMYWGNQNDGDYLDYYNGKFMGFAEADVSNPDGSVVDHHYDSTEGWGIYDSSVPCLAYIKPCHAAPWWDLTNAAHGHETETDYYDTDGHTLLRQDQASYSVTCPPSGVSGSPSWSTTLNGSPYTYTWDGRLVAELDHGNPVAVCAVQLTQSLTNTFNGSSNYARSWTNYGYDSYGRLTDATANANDGGGTGSPTVIRSHTDYIWNDSVSATTNSAIGHYLIDFPIQSYITDSASDLRTSCMRYQYDGNGYIYGQQSGLTLGEVTSSNSATDCGSASNGWTPSGVMQTTTAYDTYGNVVATTDPLGVAGNSAHLGCALSGVNYTDCLTYDSVYHTQVVSETNTLGQTSQIAYASDASGGYGLWPTSATDPNGAVTTSAYDGLGRLTSETLPGETSGLTTATWAYVVSCGGAGSGPQAPCVRVDQTQRTNATTTVAAHAFYNGYGQLAETRDQAPGGQDVVRFTEFDAATRAFRVSNPYFVPAWDGVTGFGYSTDDVNQVPTVSSYDGLGRTRTTTDPLGNVTTSSYGVTCNITWSGGSDSSCYAATSVTDANAHQSQSFTDAFGRTTYTRDLSGNGGSVPYATYRTLAATYDYAGNETTITQPNGSTTTFGYDAAGRQVWMTDPDRGHEGYTYDADGNVTQVTDARNVSVSAGYDGLNRQIWRNSSPTPNNAYVSYTYDASGHGSSIGRLTSEQFVSPTDSSLTGSYSYTYDARGQVTSSTTTLLGATYPTSTTYDDAGEPLSVTYPDGAVATTSYSQGWLAGVNWTQGGTTTPILAAVSYSGPAGAFGAITSANVGQSAGAALYHYAAQLDSDGRLLADDLVKINTGAMLYDEQVSYDPVGNVSAVTTILPAGTDHQLFCYDEQNRLTWAGTTSGNPCGNGGATGSFGGASYTQSFAYDTLNRLTSGPLGAYTYGDTNHLHAATSVSSGYTASYDAAGDMQCRAPSSSATCSGTPTGQTLTWDVEGRLSNWQNATTSPTVTAKYLYDGEGNRVVQQVVDSTAGTTTTTSYVGSLETYSITTGNQPTNITTTDYIPAGKVLAASVNGTLSYLATSYQGSVVESLDSTGTVGVTASQLYAPYGGVRYANGSMPTDYGYTGQRADASTGLDYYGARYYDPSLSQFTSADTVMDGLNRYGYVGGNPTTATDPSGHELWVGKDMGGGGEVIGAYANAITNVVGGVAAAYLAAGGLGQSLGADYPDIPDEMSRARTGGGLPGFDELRGALNRNSGGVSLSDLPSWNQVSANRYKAANPQTTTPPTTPPGPPPGPGSKPPQTQTGGGGAGAPPGGGQPPVASPAHPDDNGCGCGNNYLTFYRGTTAYAAEDVVENQALDVDRIAANQRDFGGVVEPGNVYITSQTLTAYHYADLVGGGGRAGGAAILRIEVPMEAFSSFAARYGISVETPIPRGPFPGATETRIPFEHVSEFDQFARYSLYEGEVGC